LFGHQIINYFNDKQYDLMHYYFDDAYKHFFDVYLHDNDRLEYFLGYAFNNQEYLRGVYERTYDDLLEGLPIALNFFAEKKIPYIDNLREHFFQLDKKLNFKLPG